MAKDEANASYQMRGLCPLPCRTTCPHRKEMTDLLDQSVQPDSGIALLMLDYSTIRLCNLAAEV